METEGKLTSYLRFEIFSLFGTHNPWDVLHERTRYKDGGKNENWGFSKDGEFLSEDTVATSRESV